MSDTPRTDASIIERRHIHKIGGCVELLELVDADVARKLERERDEARQHLEDIKEYGTEEINTAVELRQKLAAALLERDEAREELARIESPS